MRDHIKILGILNIVIGSLTVLGGLCLLLLSGGLVSFFLMNQPGRLSSDDAKVALPIMSLIFTCVAVVLIVVGAPAIIGGWGLLKYKPWSRVLMIVISALHLLSIPIGTALGVYGLWVLLSEPGRQLLESGGAMPPQAFTPPSPPTPVI